MKVKHLFITALVSVSAVSIAMSNAAKQLSEVKITNPSSQKDYATSVCSDGFSINVSTTGDERYNVETASFIDLFEVQFVCKAYQGNGETLSKTLLVDNTLQGGDFDISGFNLNYFPHIDGDKKYLLKLSLFKAISFRGNPTSQAVEQYYKFATNSVEKFLLNEVKTK